MAEIEFRVNAYAWHQVKTCRKFAVTEEQVQRALDALEEGMNPLGVNATELRDYLDGRGELALRVELGGADKVMQALLTRIAQLLAQYSVPDQETQHETVGISELIRVEYVGARTRVQINC
jgi:hypothetical protein